MASASKTRWAQLKIGIVAIAALVILAVLIVLMSGQNPLFRETSDVYTYFGDSFAMTVGATPVRLNGILIGKVSAVELSGEDDPIRAVRVTLSVDDEFLSLVPIDSEAGLAQQNLLGTRYVNIKRGTSAQTIQAGDEVPSSTSAELQELFEQGSSTLAALETILQRVESIVIRIEDGEGTIGRFLTDPSLYDNLVATVNEMNTLVGNFNNPESTLGRLINEDDLYTDIRGTMGRINTMVDGINAGEGTAGKLLHDDALYEELHMAVSDVRQTLKLVNEGDGLVGRMMNDDTLYTRLEGSLDRVDELVDHINSGEGTLGQLLLNPQLYETMDGTMREVRGLMQDFRSNPAKFLRIKLALF